MDILGRTKQTIAGYFRRNNDWNIKGRPLWISFIVNLLLFLFLFMVFYTERPQAVTVTITPITERLTKKVIRKKRKRIAKVRKKIRKKIKKARVAKAQAARQVSKNEYNPYADDDAGYDGSRESDSDAPTTGSSSVSESDSSVSKHSPNYSSKNPNATNSSKKSNKPKGNEAFPDDDPYDNDNEPIGPSYGKPWKVKKGNPNWGGPGSNGSHLAHDPDPSYPAHLRNQAVKGTVKFKVFFMPDGNAYKV